MYLIYIAGSYTAPTTWEVKQNILAAEQLGAEICKLNDTAFPVIPHKNTEFFEGLRDGQYFIDGTLALMLKCDAVLIVPNSESSQGTQGEIHTAQLAGIPVFYHLLDLRVWLAAKKRKFEGELKESKSWLSKWFSKLERK